MREASLIRRTIDELAPLGVDAAQEYLATSDPLDLRGLVRDALVRSALWIPEDAALRRALRGIFSGLRESRSAELTDQWLAARISTAVLESIDPHSAVDRAEQEAWARHIERVAATLGVCDALGLDAVALIHQLDLDQRTLLLHGTTLARQRRTKEAPAEFWSRFEDLIRSLIRTLTADE